MHHEKLPLQSKKFIAYMVADLSWTFQTLYLTWILHRTIVSIANGELNASLASLTSLIMAMIIVSGFVQVGFILGQTYIDRYVRVAHIASGRDDGGEKKTEGE